MDSRGFIRTDEIAGIKIAKPMANGYKSSASAVADATKAETVMLGHNSFRPDIYRVSEGYVS